MSPITIRQFLQNFFCPDIASSLLHKEIKEQRVRITELRVEYRKLTLQNHQYVPAIILLTEAMEALRKIK